jgi:hypothetical protein
MLRRAVSYKLTEVSQVLTASIFRAIHRNKAQDSEGSHHHIRRREILSYTAIMTLLLLPVVWPTRRATAAATTYNNNMQCTSSIIVRVTGVSAMFISMIDAHRYIARDQVCHCCRLKLVVKY